MELNFKTCPIGEIKTILDSSADNPFDLDVTLPDYFPDIQRVLKCIVTPGIGSTSITSGRASADGNALLRIIYTSEDRRIYCYEQTFPFSKSVEDNSLNGDMSLMATVKTDYVNCRATGQRRLNIQGVISVRFTVKCRDERYIICGCDDETLQIKSRKTDALSTVNTMVKSFVMSEIAQLQVGADSIDKILNCSCAIITDSIKAVSGKILIKGDLITDVVYSTENEPSVGINFRHTMPISQIIDVYGVTEESINNIVLKIADLSVMPKSDANGVKNQLEISVRADACISVDEKVELEVLTDAYSMNADLNCKFEKIAFKNINDKVSDTITVSDILEIGNEGIISLISLWSNDIKFSNNIKDNDLRTKGTVSLIVIYINKESEPACLEKEIDFEYVKRLSSKPESTFFEPVIQVVACKGTLNSENSVSVKLEIMINGTVYSYTENRIISKADLSDDSENKDRASLVIYFAEEGEEIWDIARRYKTTGDLIKTENQLSEDKITERKMILIPSC